jgi:hypothetical protein
MRPRPVSKRLEVVCKRAARCPRHSVCCARRPRSKRGARRSRYSCLRKIPPACPRHARSRLHPTRPPASLPHNALHHALSPVSASALRRTPHAPGPLLCERPLSLSPCAAGPLRTTPAGAAAHLTGAVRAVKCSLRPSSARLRLSALARPPPRGLSPPRALRLQLPPNHFR